MAQGDRLPADHRLAEALAWAHQEARGIRPHRFSIGSTIDARCYANQFATPAVAFGPRTRNINGADEAVELRCRSGLARCSRW